MYTIVETHGGKLFCVCLCVRYEGVWIIDSIYEQYQ